MLNSEMGALDISAGYKEQKILRKDERSKQVLALNKKLIKPFTGNNKI